MRLNHKILNVALLSAMPTVLFNHRIKIWPKSKRNINQVIPLQALSETKI